MVVLSVGTRRVELAGTVVQRRFSGERVSRDGSRRIVAPPHADTVITLSGPPPEGLVRLAGRHPEVVVDGLVLHDVRIYVRSEPPWEVVVHP